MPSDECAIDESILDIGFYGDAHVFRPVFTFARDFFRLHCEVVEYATVTPLGFGEVRHCGGQILFEMPGAPHDVRVVTDPDCWRVRGAIASDRVAIDDHIHSVFFEKSLDPRREFIEFRTSGFNVGKIGHDCDVL